MDLSKFTDRTHLVGLGIDIHFQLDPAFLGLYESTISVTVVLFLSTFKLLKKTKQSWLHKGSVCDNSYILYLFRTSVVLDFWQTIPCFIKNLFAHARNKQYLNNFFMSNKQGRWNFGLNNCRNCLLFKMFVRSIVTMFYL